MSEVRARLEPMMLGQQQQILMHLAQKLQLPQLVEHLLMAEQPFLYKTTSGKFFLFNSFVQIFGRISIVHLLVLIESLFIQFSLSSSGGMINAAEVSNYSGSGSGLPLLIQRSVARQISLINVIGSFGNHFTIFLILCRIYSIFNGGIIVNF